MKYTHDFDIGCQYTDPNGYVRVAELWRVMQDTAGLHIREKYYSIDEMQKMDMAFVMSKMCLKFYEPVMPFTKVEARTWARGRSAYKLFRNYEIADKNGNNLLCEAVTVWALIRLSDRTLLKTDALIKPVPTCDADVSVTIPQKIDTVPDSSYAGSGIYKTGYADMDTYSHMNNTRYVDLVCEYLPLTDGFRVSEISVEYKNEAVMGDEIEISTCVIDGFYFIKGYLKNGKPCFSSRVEVVKIV